MAQERRLPSDAISPVHKVAVGQDTANWTTERLAEYLYQQTGVQVTEETVRVYLHAHDYVCKRPTWTLRRKAEEKADYVGNASGERFS